MATWSGKSRGGKFGYQFFISILKYTHVKVAYFFLKFVELYFFITSNKQSSRFYFKTILAYGKLKTLSSIYKNYCLLGEAILDKITVMAGFRGKFTFTFEGEENLKQLVDQGKGGMLIGAHMGNWEVAGQLLERLKVKINIVMYASEYKSIKALLEQELKKNTAHIIAIKYDYSHLFEISEALNRNDFVVMHGDRFLPGTNTLTLNFMNKAAKFPTGPLYLASKMGVPVSFVYTLKDTATHYHFYATKSKTYAYPAKLNSRKQELKNMVQDYVSSLESIIKMYPLQWFNFYPFWDDEIAANGIQSEI
jgi:predicted LPLAT superfamily acyltransferase